MSINLSMPEIHELKPRITVVGVGGAGGNAVNNMIRANLEGVEFVATNTDAQALAQSLTERCIQLGVSITHGLGAGSRPEIGRAAAEEALDQIVEALEGSHMAFITAGMGGGTGTGAAPVIAQVAREHGILTVGVVTKPFHFEGTTRMTLADAGIEELQSFVDTLIVIPNQNLFRVANEKTTFADAFKMADDVLHAGVRGVTDLMIMPGLINLDFADVRAVMGEMGKAMMGTGEAEGDKRAIDAAEAAISNPLLDDVSMKGARGVLINITGGSDMTLFEVDEAANRIRDEVDPDANIIFGSTFDDSLAGRMRVSVVATGIDADAAGVKRPPLTIVSDAVRRDPGGVQPRLAAVRGSAAVAVAAHFDEAPEDANEPAVSRAEPVVETEPTPLELTEAVPDEAPVSPEPVAVESADAAARREPGLKAVREPFIAPRPVQPTPRRTAQERPDPFAEAEVANAGGGRRSAPSLFQRITRSNFGRASEAASGPESEPAEPAKTDNPPADEPEPAPAPDLIGTSARSEEDLLEIPAFLRRQAN